MKIVKKAIIKRVADIMEKLGVASVAVALFQGNVLGAWLGLAFFAIGCTFTIWKAKQ